MRVLITGIASFVGSHLAEYALDQGAEVVGCLRGGTQTDRIEGIKDRVLLVKCELQDASAVQALVDEAWPDSVFHLAARTCVSASWSAPVALLECNVGCQVNLLEAIRARKLDPAIHIAGAEDEYGLVFEGECPIDETNPIRPLSPYGVSKVAQDFLGYQYFIRYGLRVVRTRAFSHTGPRQDDGVVGSNVARQIVEIERGLRPPIIRVGNLALRRDLCDVRDVVRGYWLAAHRATPGEVYNIATGQAYSLRDVVERFLALTGLQRGVQIVQSGDPTRPSDVPLLVGNSNRLTSETGWSPAIPLDRTLADLLDYWRGRLDHRVP